jgi:hypothetical protein
MHSRQTIYMVASLNVRGAMAYDLTVENCYRFLGFV